MVMPNLTPRELLNNA
nr:unnamed protein product [Callosobruchus chinensis]